MSLDKRNGMKIAGVVLSGTLVFGTAVPAIAAPDAVQTEEAALTEEKEQVKETVAFLNITKEEKNTTSEDKKEGPFDDQAVHSLEEAFSIFGISESEETEEDAENSEEEAEETGEDEVRLILVLCGDTELTEEELQLVQEHEILLMSDLAYEEELKRREELAKAEAEKAETGREESEESTESGEMVMPTPEISVPETEAPEEILPPFIWQAPEQVPAANDEGVLIIVPEENAAETPDQTVIEEPVSGDNAIIIEVEEKDTEDKDTEDTGTTVEDVVYDLFNIFGEEEVLGTLEVEETVELEAADAVQTEQQTSVETTDEKPVQLTLPGHDLVGNGISGVGNGAGSSTSKPAGGSTTKPATTTPSAKPSSGTQSQNTANQTTVPQTSTPAATKPATTTPATTTRPGTGYVQTGDNSKRQIWGLTAVMSAAMAAFFTEQWRRLKRED